MNITTLQYFVSAAELSSFTKAAKKHYVAQTAISQQMAKLEGHLGIKLFEREKNRVILTDAGQIFYEDIINVLHEYEIAIQKARRFHQKQKKMITIGYNLRHELRLLTQVIKEFEKSYPQVEFVIKEGDGGVLVEEVKNGLCDIFVNISCTLSPADKEYVDQYTIYTGSMLLAVSENHPKANYEYIEAKELADEEFIVLNVNNAFRGFQEMNEHCIKDGYEMKIADYAPSLGAQLMMVELERGVTFVQDLLAQKAEGNIRYLPIHNSNHKYDVDIMWNKDNQEEYIHQFINFVKRTLPKGEV